MINIETSAVTKGRAEMTSFNVGTAVELWSRGTEYAGLATICEIDAQHYTIVIDAIADEMDYRYRVDQVIQVPERNLRYSTATARADYREALQKFYTELDRSNGTGGETDAIMGHNE